MGDHKKLIPPQGGSGTAPPMTLPRGRSSNFTGPNAETTRHAYAITVTVTDGDRTHATRYEAPTIAEVLELAGKNADDTVEIVTLTESR